MILTNALVLPLKTRKHYSHYLHNWFNQKVISSSALALRVREKLFNIQMLFARNCSTFNFMIYVNTKGHISV